MNRIIFTDELLNRAFELAYFILGDRTASIYVAMAATDKLKTASTIQDRRHYYTPTGRFAYPATRTKVNLGHIHLLQRLVYTESEPFERLLEGQEKPLQQHDMIIRFIKHLVRITTKYNSFYVALGLSRLLYNYTTSEATEIFNLVIQDPDRGRDNYYYRSRKKHLLRELKERFGKSVKTYRGYRGEERFETQEDSGKYLSLVKECLSRFTPWESFCVLPANIDPTRNIVDPLLFKGKEPDEEHEIELNRIHTLLHPACFEKLAKTLDLDSPAQRLEIPHFFITSNDRGATDDRFKPEELSKGELEAIRRYLEKNAIHRKDASRRLLSILIDGDEQDCFEVGQTRGVQISLEKDSEFIEVRSLEENEEVPLAIHLLTYDEHGILPSKASLMLGWGQRLTFIVQPSDDSSDEAMIASVNYQELKAFRLMSLFLRKDELPLSYGARLRQWSGINLRIALGFLLIATCITGFWIYLQSGNESPKQELIAEQKDDNNQRPQAHLEPEAQQNRPRSREAAAQHNQRRQQQPPSPSSSSGQNEATRGRKPGLDAAMLLAVKRVYVDPVGEESWSRQLRQALINNLQSSNRFLVVEARGEADAVFKGSVQLLPKSVEKISVTLRLVNAKGQVIWSRAYSGYALELGDRIIRDLLADIQRVERTG